MRTRFWIALLIIIAFLYGCRAAAPPKGKIGVETAWAASEEAKIEEPSKTSGKVLAKVGDKAITEEMLEERIKLLRPRMRIRLSDPRARKNFLNTMVDTEVLYKESESQGLDKDEDVVARVEEYKKMQAVSKLREKLLESIKVSDGEVEAEYKEQIDRYKTPKQVKVSQIVFVWDKGASEKDIAAVEKQAQDVLARAKKGEDFAELARKYSVDQASAENGGDIGFVSKRLTPPHVYEAAMKLQKSGEISSPVKGEEDIRILMASEVVPEKTRPLEEVKPWLERSLLNQKKRTAWTEYVEGLRKKAYVETYPDRLTGEKKGKEKDSEGKKTTP